MLFSKSFEMKTDLDTYVSIKEKHFVSVPVYLKLLSAVIHSIYSIHIQEQRKIGLLYSE